MRKIKLWVQIAFGFLLMAILVFAFTPVDNIDLKNRLSVNNATNISSKLFIQQLYTSCNNGSTAIMTYANGTEFCGNIAIASGSGSTYNVTYDNIAGNANTCPSGQVVNGFYINGSPKCAIDSTTSGGTYNATYDAYASNVSQNYSLQTETNIKNRYGGNLTTNQSLAAETNVFNKVNITANQLIVLANDTGVRDIALQFNGNNASIVKRDELNGTINQKIGLANDTDQLQRTSTLNATISQQAFNPVNVSKINDTETWTANKTTLSLIPAFNITNSSGFSTNKTSDLGNASNFWNKAFIYTLEVVRFTNLISYGSLNLANSILGSDIVDGTIAAAEIAPNAINQSAILNGAINGSKIADKSVNKSQLATPVADLIINYTAAGGYISTLGQGGTNAALTASNGAMCYSTASALALSAVGSSADILTSGGAGAPTWTGSTGTGNVVRTLAPNITSANNYNLTTFDNVTFVVNNASLGFRVRFSNGTAIIKEDPFWNGTCAISRSFQFVDAYCPYG